MSEDDSLSSVDPITFHNDSPKGNAKEESSNEFYKLKRGFPSSLKHLVFPSSNSNESDSEPKCCCSKKTDDDDFELSRDSDDLGTCGCAAYIIAGLNFFYKLVIAISVCLVLLDLVVSFYSIIIINYVFFISTIVSYVLSPLYHGLSEDWIPYAFSLVQIILANPMIEFFIYFVIKTVKNFIDSISEFATLIKFAFVSAINSGYSKLRNIKLWPSIADKNLIRQLGLVLASLLIFAAACGITYVTFGISKMMILLGMIPYAVIVIQIIILLVPTYFYYGRISRGVKSNDKVPTEQFLKDAIETFNEFLRDVQDINDEVGMQTDQNVFNDTQFHPLELSSESYMMSGKDAKDTAQDDREKEQSKLLAQIAVNLSPLFVAVEYVPLFDYTLEIGHDKFTHKRKTFLLYLFSFLHFATVAFDIYRLLDSWSVYFLISIVLRIIFFPLFCYFNIGTAFLYKAKSAMLHFVVIVSTAFTFIVFIASVCVLFYTQFISGMTRISDLDYIPNSTILHQSVFNDACFYSYQGLSLIDAYGLALGPFDVERNYTIFDNQMKYFFGPEWNETITYEVHYIDKRTPFLIYTINESLIVYGFRGFSSGTELCLQIEMLAIQYVLPFCQDIVPFYRIFVDNFIDFYSRFAHNFGNQFFDPVSLSSLFVDPIEAVYQSKNYPNDAQIVFTGINIGGMFSKVLGMIHKKQGIGFITFPAFNDYFLNSFDFEDDDSVYITNVYNYNGWFTKQEPDLATNIGVPWISGPNFIERDSVYRSFCTITEMCGMSPKFSNYCNSVVDDMGAISEFFNSVSKTNSTIEREI